jgi:hypothetical protein
VRGEGCPGKLFRRRREENLDAIFVLAGLVPWAFSPRTRSVGIHALGGRKEDVDARIKSAQDDLKSLPESPAARGGGLGWGPLPAMRG